MVCLELESGIEHSRKAFLQGSGIPIFRFGATNSSASEEQCLLDSLLLAQWEDHAQKGLLKYDVSSCETKVVVGGRNFVVLLNESWDANCFKKRLGEDVLFCVGEGDKDSSEIIFSDTIPPAGMFVVINENPVEYGHVFMLPCNPYHPSDDETSLEFVIRFSAEVKNRTFYAFYDHPTSISDRHFQAIYFPNRFAVELAPVLPFAGDDGVRICELADYPTRALVFIGKEQKSLVRAVSQIRSRLERENTPFSLLVSDAGSKVFLFPQAGEAGRAHLAAWECGGHLVVNDPGDFDQATEAAIWKRLAAVSVSEGYFEEVKLMCRGIASG